VKLLRNSSIIFVALTLTACYSDPKPEVVYKEKIRVVKVPVKCVTPNVKCVIDQNETDVGVVETLVKCIIDLKRANKVCK